LSNQIDSFFKSKQVQEEFKDTEGIIRIRKSKDRKHNDQKKKNKQRSTKHYTEN